jgi:3-hydroxyisobutyrate dehydrogenase-like beta-hydroxyacid dehydrogenase
MNPAFAIVPIDITFKDQELETAFAKKMGVPLILANVTPQLYQAARAADLNKEDGLSVIKVLETLAGVQVGSPETSQ